MTMGAMDLAGAARAVHSVRLVDALDPASTALEAAAARGADPGTALAEAAAAAERGREAARQMMAQHGKAAVFREQTIGVEDPGAAVGALILEGFARSWRGGLPCGPDRKSDRLVND
jgi:hypothetical protein